MRGLFEGAVYSKGANYSRKYGSCYFSKTRVSLLPEVDFTITRDFAMFKNKCI